MQTEKIMKKKKKTINMESLSETAFREPRLTLKYLFDTNQEVWVRNKSAQFTPNNKSGNVVMQVGQPPYIDKVVIPPGEDPVCLTDQTDKDSLQKCRDLVKLVQSGTLELLDPKYAHVYYSQNKDRKEAVQKRISEFLAGANTPQQLRERFRAQRKDMSSVTIHPVVTDVCHKVRHGIISERDAIEQLMTQEASISEDDCTYLLKNGVFTNIKRWATQKLQQRAARG